MRTESVAVLLIRLYNQKKRWKAVTVFFSSLVCAAPPVVLSDEELCQSGGEHGRCGEWKYFWRVDCELPFFLYLFLTMAPLHSESIVGSLMSFHRRVSTFQSFYLQMKLPLFTKSHKLFYCLILFLTISGLVSDCVEGCCVPELTVTNLVWPCQSFNINDFNG